MTISNGLNGREDLINSLREDLPHLIFAGKTDIIGNAKDKRLIATPLVLREVLEVLENILFREVRSWRTKPIVARKGIEEPFNAMLNQKAKKRVLSLGSFEWRKLPLKPTSVAESWQEDASGAIEPLLSQEDPSIVDS